MRLLVTRPEPDALLLKARLEALDHEATVAPLSKVSFEDAEPIDLTEAGALIATSRNGLKALKVQGVHKVAALLPVYAVGQATARDARALGFTTVIVGNGTAADLVPEIVATADPQADILLHLAGDETAGRLAADLEAHGFRVMRPVVYRMIPATSLDPDTVEQIATGEVDGVLLFSPRAAAIYAGLIESHDLVQAARRLRHFCLSDAVARRLAPLGAVRTEIAEQPTLDAMLALLE